MTTAPSEDDKSFLKKLADDPIFFIESCISIVDKNSKKVPFLLNYAQKLYLINRTFADIILKARKMGFSTLILALWLHACLFRQNTYAVIVSHDKDATKKLFGRLKYMIKHCGFPINIGKETAEEIHFPDTDSKIYIGTAGNRSFGRGDDITHLHLSEPAFYESLDVITAVGEALVKGAYMVLESTANGAGTPYHELWLNAELKINNFKHHFMAWFLDQGYRIASPPFELTDYEKKLKDTFALDFDQIAWYRNKERSMIDKKLVKQEHPSTPEEAFLTSGRMVFDWEAIASLEADARAVKWRGFLRDMGNTSRIEPNAEGPFMVWKTMDERVDYLITADASQGVPGLDYSVADVWDTRTWEQVAQFRGYIEPDRFADFLYNLGGMYGWAVIAPEVNFPGNAVVARLKARSYPHLWVDAGGRGEPGFQTTEKSKALIVTDARQAIRDLDMRINSRYTLSELKTFCVQDNGKLEAQGGCHDDTVITLAIGAYILKRWALDPEVKKRSWIGSNRRRGRGSPSGSIRPKSGKSNIV